MRIGLDLRAVADADQRVRLATEADRLGLWAVLTAGDGPGTESLDAAELAAATEAIHVVVWLADSTDHPFTLAEEVAVLDHLSARRAAAVVTDDMAERVTGWLAGRIIDGVALTPPPAQTFVPVWAPADLAAVDLSGDLDADRGTIDRFRDDGATHLIVAWPGELIVLARHLASRAVGPDFPQLVADMADRTGRAPEPRPGT